MVHDPHTGAHTDIRQDSPVIRLSPPALQPYLKLARLDRPVGIWLLFWPCLWGLTLASSAGIAAAAIFPPLPLVLLFAAGAVIMRAAGCVINDLWDRAMDARVERTRSRPLASGEVTRIRALIFLSGLLACGLFILLTLNRTTILLGILSLPLVATYPLMKRVTWWPQLFLGITFNWGALMGWSAVTGAMPSLPAFFLYLAGVFWTLGYDTIYAHQDARDDRIAGLKSTALLFGERSRDWIAFFYMLTLFFAFCAVCFAGLGWKMGLVALVPAGLHFTWQISAFEPDRPESCLAVFQSNQLAGLLLWLIFLTAAAFPA